jgi:hypothetical protein
MAGTKTGANRQTAESRCPGAKRRADGEQYGLQRERIGRHQRHHRAHFMPGHRCRI